MATAGFIYLLIKYLLIPFSFFVYTDCVPESKVYISVLIYAYRLPVIQVALKIIANSLCEFLYIYIHTVAQINLHTINKPYVPFYPVFLQCTEMSKIHRFKYYESWKIDMVVPYLWTVTNLAIIYSNIVLDFYMSNKSPLDEK